MAIGGWRRQKMMSWNVFLDVFGCVRMCSNVFGDQHIRTHANTSEHIQTHSKHIQTHPNTLRKFVLAFLTMTKASETDLTDDDLLITFSCLAKSATLCT